MTGTQPSYAPEVTVRVWMDDDNDDGWYELPYSKDHAREMLTALGRRNLAMVGHPRNRLVVRALEQGHYLLIEFSQEGTIKGVWTTKEFIGMHPA